MEMEGSSDILNLGTGVTVDKKSIVWKIDNFNVVVKEDLMINAQKVEFETGDKLGIPSTWTFFLQKCTKADKKNWIGVYYNVKKRPANFGDYFYSQVVFFVKNKEGWITWRADTGMKNLAEMTVGWGVEAMLDTNQNQERKCLEIYITFTTYFPTPKLKKCFQITVESMVEVFQAKFASKARKDVAAVIKKSVAGSDIKIISNDGKEFAVPKGILIARSPVFEAMLLRSNMSEANKGVIKLTDISGGALEVLVNFIYTGELIPAWRQSSVVVELTNAAAKYELKDLLEFLDLTLGKVCDLENVAPLFALANRLSLKTAEKELLKFVQEKGVNSSQNFVQMIKIISGMAV